MPPQGAFDVVKGYVGLIGGAIAIVKFLLDGVSSWRGRGRLEIDMIGLKHYEERYSESDVERARERSSMLNPEVVGRVRRAFSILEFVVRNTYTVPVTVGLMQIDDWISADRQIGTLSDGRVYARGDFRTFDLHSKQPVSLGPWVLLRPGDVLGRRVEILEGAEGPGFVHLHQRYVVPERNQFVLRFASTRGTIVKAIAVGESAKKSWFSGDIVCWSGSDLVVTGRSPDGARGERLHRGHPPGS